MSLLFGLALLADEGGNVTARHGYMPFGEEIFTAGGRIAGLGESLILSKALKARYRRRPGAFFILNQTYCKPCHIVPRSCAFYNFYNPDDFYKTARFL
jgi:hypothetical protein